MKILCAPSGFNFRAAAADLGVVLYKQADIQTLGSVGAAVQDEVASRKLAPSPRAWDLLSIAMAAVATDLAGHRVRSPDGWTREFELTVALADAAFWNTQADLIAQLLNYLTTDRWSLRFIDGGHLPRPPQTPTLPVEERVALLSGGLDSLIGAIDLTASGRKPFVVSELVRGDARSNVISPH
jgi:hypothetical protein